MINSREIYNRASKTVRQFGTRDALKIAEQLGVVVYYRPFTKLLGMYTCVLKQRTIIVNSALDETTVQMVVAHELGHDAYHKKLVKDEGLREFNLFKIKDDSEYVANAYAAHLLLDSAEVYKRITEGTDVNTIACEFNCNVNMLLIKLNEMTKLGYEMRTADIPKHDFLRNVGDRT